MFRLCMRPGAMMKPLQPTQLISTHLGRAAPLMKPLRGPRVRFQSTTPPKSAKPTGIKALVKEYGYSALGVYLFLSMLDLPVCYLVVHSLGKEQIEVYENQVKQYFGYGKSDAELQHEQAVERAESTEPAAEGMFAWFSWTEFALAYGLHKSVFIFVRVPLTAALTPLIVKMLRGWGFKIGSDRLATTAAIASDTIASAAATSAKFGTRATRGKKWFWFF